MADTKISALTAATTPLAGTEVLPIVQSGATVKVANNDLRPKQIQSNATSGVLQVVGPASASTRVATVPDANFTVARTDAAQSFTGDQTLTTGNVIVASGQGIDFSATSHPAGMTSELLNDYEEGTWTPSLGGNTTYTQQVGEYTKIGRIVYLRGTLQINVLGTGSTTAVTGLPFNGINKRAAGSCGYYGNSAVNVNQLTPVINSTTMTFVSSPAAGTTVTDSPAIFGNGTFIFFTVTYQT